MAYSSLRLTLRPLLGVASPDTLAIVVPRGLIQLVFNLGRQVARLQAEPADCLHSIYTSNVGHTITFEEWPADTAACGY